MKIAVYCGSGFGNDEAYRRAADALGAWLAHNGHTLVYGGGDDGLMGVVAKAAYSGGVPVIGALPGNVAFICERPQPYCTEVITCADMNARKRKMLELADAFIALPGGIGTIDEVSEVITLTKIGVFNKPVVLYNEKSFYEPFRDMLTMMQQTGFIGKNELDFVLYSSDLDEIGSFLKQYC